MAAVKMGDRVSIADREPVAADAKNGLFYGYFRSLSGVIERVYDDNTVCVNVDVDSLPEDVRMRHKEMEAAARDKWINGLSQEQRNRLTEADKQFRMNYKVVVSADDVSPSKGGPAKPPARVSKKSDTAVAGPGATPAAPGEKPPEEKAASASAAERPVKKPEASAHRAEAVMAEPKPAASRPAGSTASEPESAEAPKRLTEKDIAAAEREFLRSLKAQQKGEAKSA